MLAAAIPEMYQADKIGVLDVREILGKDISLFSEIRLFWLITDEDFPVPENPAEEIEIKQ